MIGIIQVAPAPYRDETFEFCSKEYECDICVATFPDGMDTHPEWGYKPIKEDYKGLEPQTFNICGRKMVFNKDIKEWLTCRKYDALLIEGYNSFTNIYAIIFALKHKIPIILGVDTVRKTKFQFFKRVLYKKVSAFWVPGNRTKAYLVSENIENNKIFLGKYTYNYKSIYRKIKEKDKKIFRQELGIDADCTVLLFVGKLIPSRNIGSLLKVFSSIEDDSLRILIIGDGPEENKVKKLGDKRILHIPAVTVDKLYKYYAASDIYIHPGSEPYSLAIVQAVASDLAIVSTKQVGAVDDVVRSNGILFDIGDEAAFQKALMNVVDNIKIFKEEAVLMGKYVRDKRSVEYAAEQLHEAIKFSISCNHNQGNS